MSLQIFQPWGSLSLSLSVCTVYPGEPQIQQLCPGPRDGCHGGADRCQVGGGAGIVCPQSVALDTGDTPCAAKELVTQEIERNAKPSLQQMPSKRCCFCCISEYHLECWCKQWMQGEKNTELRKIHPSRAPPKPVTQDAKTPSSLCTKVTFVKSSRAGFSMLMAQQLSLPSSNNQVSQRASSA